MAQEESSRGDSRLSDRDRELSSQRQSVGYPHLGDLGSPTRRLSFSRGMANFSTAPETLSSTVRASSSLPKPDNAGRRRRGIEHDIEDSDEGEVDLDDLDRGTRTPERGNTSNRPISPPPTGVSKRAQPLSRRLTFNLLEEAEEGIHLTDENFDPPVDFTIADHEDLLTKVNNRPQEVMETLHQVMYSWRATETQRQELLEENRLAALRMEKLKGMNSSQSSTIAKLNEELLLARSLTDKFKDDAAWNSKEAQRYKGLRDQHRVRGDDLAKEAETLQADKDNLEREVQGLQAKLKTSRSNDTRYINDSDNEDGVPRRTRAHQAHDAPQYRQDTTGFRPTAILPRPRDNGPAGLFGPAREDHHEAYASREERPKYTELFDFDGDRDVWEQWRVHLETKVWTCHKDFPTEQHKINYARDHCKKLAYKTIKHRAILNASDPYLTLQELIQDLENAFGDTDERTNAINELFAPSFPMRVSKRSESFDEFLARFNSQIAGLNFDDEFKIAQLRRTITDRLNYGMKHLTRCKNYRLFCDEARGVYDLDKRMEDKRKGTARSETSRAYTTENGPTRVGRGPVRAKLPSAPIGKLPAHVQAKLIATGGCFKCLKPGHRKSDVDAPCKNDPLLSREQAIARLAGIGAEWDGEDAAEYESDLEDTQSGDECAHHHNYSEN